MDPAEAATRYGGPGRVFCLRTEVLYDLALEGEEKLPSGWMKVVGMAGSRQLAQIRQEPEEWLRWQLLEEQHEENEWLEKQEHPLLVAS